MAQQDINCGTVANDGTGDTLRAAFVKAQANFDELYSGLGFMSGTGWSGAAGNFTAYSVAAARSIPLSSGNRTLTINGNITGGDLVTFGDWVWDNLSVLAHNGASVIASNDAGTGRWIQNP